MITILLSKNIRTIKPKIAGKRRRIAFLASLSLSQNLVRYEFVHWRESLRKRACILCHLCADMLYFPKMYSICIASSCFALRSLPLLSPFHPAPSPSSSLMVITQQQEEDAGWVICILYQTKSTPSPMSIVSSSPAHPQHSSKHEPGNQLPYPSSHGDLAAACKSDGGTDARVSLVFLDARSVSSGNI